MDLTSEDNLCKVHPRQQNENSGELHQHDLTLTNGHPNGFTSMVSQKQAASAFDGNASATSMEHSFVNNEHLGHNDELSSRKATTTNVAGAAATTVAMQTPIHDSHETTQSLINPGKVNVTQVQKPHIDNHREEPVQSIAHKDEKNPYESLGCKPNSTAILQGYSAMTRRSDLAMKQLGSNRSCVSDLSFPDIELSSGHRDIPTHLIKKRNDSSYKEMNVISTECAPVANCPHPSLEYPPLYFILKGYPSLLEAIRTLYRFRWSLYYPLQKRVVFSQTLRKMGIFLTWGELLFLIPYFIAIIVCTIFAFVYPNVSITGHACRKPLMFAYASAMHNSIFTLLMGIPFERALFYHKLSGRIAFVNAILHIYVSFLDHDIDGFVKFSFLDKLHAGGSMLMLFLAGMVITSLPAIRRKVFELFYYIHIIFAAAMLGCAYFHTGYLVPLLGALGWGGDLIIRKGLMAATRYPRQAKVRIVSESVVELSFPKSASFDYNPGQFIYLAVPELSIFQWHPFSLSSSPQQKVVTLHIRTVGSWTTALLELARTKSEISILLEGPYGSLSVDLMSDRYKMVMMFSGGIGVTPMQSICNQLIYEHSTKQRELKKLTFVWIERDPVVMTNLDVVRRSNSAHFAANNLQALDLDDKSVEHHSIGVSSIQSQVHDGGMEGIASIILGLVPVSNTTDEQLGLDYPAEEFEPSNDNASNISSQRSPSVESSSLNDNPVGLEEADMTDEEYPTEPVNNGCFSVTDTFLDQAYNDQSSSKAPTSTALDLKVFLTGQNIHPGIKDFPFVHLGRPNVKDLFLQMKQDAKLKGEKRVAVCVCAPKRLADICRSACVTFSDKTVRFDFHQEVFG